MKAPPKKLAGIPWCERRELTFSSLRQDSRTYHKVKGRHKHETEQKVSHTAIQLMEGSQGSPGSKKSYLESPL